MVSEASIEAKSKDDETTLRILKVLPVAAAIQASYTYTQKEVPGIKNNTISMPQELALYFAGEITPKIGSGMKYLLVKRITDLRAYFVTDVVLNMDRGQDPAKRDFVAPLLNLKDNFCPGTI